MAETGRLTEEKRELSATEQAELNQRLCFLAEHLKDQPKVSIEYFIPDERKSGGAYRAVNGSIKKIWGMHLTQPYPTGCAILISSYVTGAVSTAY